MLAAAMEGRGASDTMVQQRRDLVVHLLRFTEQVQKAGSGMTW